MAAAPIQSGFVSRCMNAVRTLPVDSGINFPWTFIVERLSMDRGSLVLPVFDFSEGHIKQTAGRVVYALILLDPFCKLAVVCNGVLGAMHFVWCVCNIKRFHSQELDRNEFEKTIIRLSTAVYDLAIVFFLSPYCPGSGYLKGLLFLTIALSPQQFMQFHHAIFAHAEKEMPNAAPAKHEEDQNGEAKPAAAPPKEIDYNALREDCLIKVFAKGWTDAWLPPAPQSTWKDRLLALPSGLTSYTASLYQGMCARIFARNPAAPK